MKKYFLLLVVVGYSVILFSCTQKQGVSYLRYKLPRNSNIAVIVDAPNNIKNVILTKFLQRGFRVKAVNASDLYTLSDIFDIKDYKYLAYEESEILLSHSQDLAPLTTTQNTYSNIYKLHIYNFEAHKAEILSELKNKWNIRYLILLELKDWQQMSWGRAIDIETYDIIWIENYPAAYSDTLETVVEHFIANAVGR